ncbi:hypothetical protein FOC1_g10006491 [Fusarium oxysporum f. sp. cubense race 1]|uniref:Uncharacterized protein n=1 Tax=Fusarium oxysporum f. sp. cubense (strain race 1) TaxID=1229664 RepID=N4UPV9_FUSC1|nr:hypothetical protein FOC1_g10006491 [Fusarium oxysporum f. sp. cubense race 1]
MAAPIEVAAHYPVLTGLNRELPVGVQTRPTAIERIKRTEPKLREYKEMLQASEGKMGNKSGATPIADLLLLDAASVFQNQVRYQATKSLLTISEWKGA